MLALSSVSAEPVARGPFTGVDHAGIAHGETGIATALGGQILDYGAGEEIHGEGEPARFVYRVVSGVVRTFTLLSDGRRQIAAFNFAGDVFGLDVDDIHHLSAEAVSDARVLAIRRTQVEVASRHDCRAAREMWALTHRALEKARAQMLLLGRRSALEKVATFLLQMAQHGTGKDAIDLPMSRSDIADYLGLTIETVSRTLSQLERAGTIVLTASRHIELRDRSQLAALTD